MLHQQWAGPLPPPAALAEFNEVVPNGAERIFAAWETETAHRRDMEAHDLRWSIIEGLVGKVFAFLFAIASLGLAGYVATIGALWLAGLFGVGFIGSMVWAFVNTNRTGKQPPAKPPPQ